MRIREIMNTDVVSITPDESVRCAARLMSRHNIGALPVCAQDGRLRGMVTDRDIVLRCVADDTDPEELPVREIMTRAIVSAAPDDDVAAVAGRMADSQVRRIPVVENGRVVGMVALGDLARRRTCAMEAARALCDISVNIRHK